MSTNRSDAKSYERWQGRMGIWFNQRRLQMVTDAGGDTWWYVNARWWLVNASSPTWSHIEKQKNRRQVCLYYICWWPLYRSRSSLNLRFAPRIHFRDRYWRRWRFSWPTDRCIFFLFYSCARFGIFTIDVSRSAKKCLPPLNSLAFSLAQHRNGYRAKFPWSKISENGHFRPCSERRSCPCSMGGVLIIIFISLFSLFIPTVPWGESVTFIIHGADGCRIPFIGVENDRLIASPAAPAPFPSSYLLQWWSVHGFQPWDAGCLNWSAFCIQVRMGPESRPPSRPSCVYIEWQ